MFYGLAHLEDTYHANNVHKMIALAPCFVASDLLCPDIISENEFQDKGIYNFFGPHWEENLETICSNYSATLCDHFTNSTDQPYSVQDVLHWGQNHYAERFQEFMPTWSTTEFYADYIQV